MKTTGNWRTVLNRSCIVVIGVIVLVWAGSIWWQVQWIGKNNLYQFLIQGGCVVLRGPYLSSYPMTEYSDAHPVQALKPGWSFEKSRWPGVETFTVEDCLTPIETFTAIYTTQKAIAVWPLAIPPIVIVSIPPLRRKLAARRTAQLHQCPKCNYDRRGITQGSPCPECGTGG